MTVDELDARVVLGLVGLGDPPGCAIGTPDGPCPNEVATTVAAAAAHPADGEARWLVRAWTPVCGWHRDALGACMDLPVEVLWDARGGAAASHPVVDEPIRRGLARWLRRTPDGTWLGELGL